MRLPCDVVVVSRLLPSAGMRAPGRAARALLALGKPTGGEGGVCLLVSTARHRPGAKYQLKENIDQLFTKFVDEGKATLRLKEPAVDICLSKSYFFQAMVTILIIVIKIMPYKLLCFLFCFPRKGITSCCLNAFIS
uniref:PIF1/LRR1 pleckstrin homology domain-containing protein n=1 Tax=Pseudonaja textilis TaxID=8673 RepID=A0A670XUF5_PSETE